jgi:hypothetical protein
VAAGIREAILFEIYGDDSTGRDGLGKTYRDRSLAAAAIEDCRVGVHMPEKKVGVDGRAAGLNRGLERGCLSAVSP